MLLKNGKVLCDNFEFENTDVAAKGGVISFDTDGETNVIDCTDCLVVPGLIDIHTHGALGFEAADASPESIMTVAKFMANHGVTTYLPTLATESFETYIKAAENIRFVSKSGTGGANIGGIHMEGPYFSEKYKGAQNADELRLPSVSEFDEINAASGNMVKMISLAPELSGAFDFIKQRKDTVKISIGHTDSDYETAIKAIDLGASALTHSFNAMRGYHHRTPNAVGAALDRKIFCECICDGLHLSPACIRLIYNCVGADKMVMISDSITPTGLPDGEATSGGLKVYIKNGEARLFDGTIAGSTSNLLEGVRNVIKFGIKPEHAFKAASINPAKAIGIADDVGSITSGKRADLLVLDSELNLKHVIINGKIFK